MKRIFAVVLLIASLCSPVVVHAASLDVLITSVQTESAASASEEYIIVTNNSAASIDVTDWHLQYFSATAANFDSPTRNIALTGSLASHASLLAASSGYKTDQATVSFGAGFSSTGGHIRLVSGSGATLQQHDLLGWGNAAHPETTAVEGAAKGQVYMRKTDSSGVYIDTDNNSNDFTNGSTAAPPAGSTDGGSDADPVPDAPTVSAETPQITELLPDPVAPATDATGEFVELYNPNDTALDLTGYKLQTGTSNTYSYTFKSGSLAAGEYKAFYAPETKLTLSNTSGKARLLDSSGTVVSETSAYGKAPTGSSWMLNGGTWAWTALPTPGAENGTAVLGTTTTTAKTTATKAATSKTATAKAKTTAAAKPKAAAKSTAATTYSDYKDPASDNHALPVSPLLLAVVGVPLIGYMVYEYRHDLANFYAKLRRNRSRRRETRPAASGR